VPAAFRYIYCTPHSDVIYGYAVLQYSLHRSVSLQIGSYLKRILRADGVIED